MILPDHANADQKATALRKRAHLTIHTAMPTGRYDAAGLMQFTLKLQALSRAAWYGEDEEAQRLIKELDTIPDSEFAEVGRIAALEPVCD